MERCQNEKLEDREALPRKNGNLHLEYQAMHEANFFSSWLLEDVEDKAEERESMNQEAKEDASRSRKREVEGERERVETCSKSICVDRLDSPDVGKKVWEAFCSSCEVENVGVSVDLSLCVCLPRLLWCLW